MRESFVKDGWDPIDPIGASIPAKYKASMDPWVKQFLTLDKIQIWEVLEARYSKVGEWLEPLCDRLRWFKEYSVFCQASPKCQRDYLGLGENAWANHFLPPMTDPGIIKNKLQKLGLLKVKGLAEFLKTFDGLRDAPPDVSGGFIPITTWEPAQSHYLYKDFDDDVIGKWWDAVPILLGGNGDSLLLKQSGKIGWLCGAEQCVTPRSHGFANFIEVYADQGVPDFYSDPYAGS